MESNQNTIIQNEFSVGKTCEEGEAEKEKLREKEREREIRNMSMLCFGIFFREIAQM